MSVILHKWPYSQKNTRITKDNDRLKNYFELMENKNTRQPNATLILDWARKKILMLPEFSGRYDET